MSNLYCSRRNSTCVQSAKINGRNCLVVPGAGKRRGQGAFYNKHCTTELPVSPSHHKCRTIHLFKLYAFIALRGLPRWCQWKGIHLPMQETKVMWVRSLGLEELLQQEMASHSCILARKIPWAEEPGRLQSMGLQ